MVARVNGPRQAATWCAFTAAGVVAAQLVSTALWDQRVGTHLVWFPGAVLLGALLTTTHVVWPALLASGYLTLVATICAFGLPVPDVALVTLPTVLLVPVAAYAMRRLRRHVQPLQDFRMLLGFTLLVVFALPAATATLTVLLGNLTILGDTVLANWANITSAHAIGYALFLPAWCSLRSRHSALREAGGVDLGFVTLMALAFVLLVIVWYAFGDRQEYRPLLCLIPAPLVIAAIFAAQMAGSSVAMFLIALIAAHLTAHGHGPFIASTSEGTTLALQVWTLVASLSALVVAMTVEQRLAARRSLMAAHTELRELAGRLIATQEQERARIARDLHDDINQRLAAASIDLCGLRKRLPAPFRDEVHALQDRVVALSDDVRLLSHQLHPSCLQHTGLRSALESLCRHPQGHAWPSVRIVADDAIDALAPDMALCFYRVAQEALANAVRHAGAHEVILHADIRDGIATLRIIDDGNGFGHAPCPATPPGIGITSMRERAKLLGGSFDICSTPGKGVDLCIRIPTTPT